MENRKGSGIFLSVIGVATLIVAIIGATFAYFSASAVSNNDAIQTQSTELALGYSDNTDGLNTNLIPAEERYALYAGTNADWINKVTDGATGLCLDDYGNEICSTYEFTIGNSSFTTSMNINGFITVTVNEFQNLKLAIYNEKNEQVLEPTDVPAAGETIQLGNLGQEDMLLPSSLDVDNTNFVEENPDTYTPIDAAGAEIENWEDGGVIAANKRKFKIVIWIEETVNEDQTEYDAGKIFTAGVTFNTGSGSGVTGVIAAADKE